MHKRFFFGISVILFIASFIFSGSLSKNLANTQAQNLDAAVGNDRIDAVYFYQDTCGVCREVKPTIDELDSKYNLNLQRYEVTTSNENRSRFGAFAIAYGRDQTDNHVPVIYVGDKYFMGYDPITQDLEPYLQSCQQDGASCNLKLDPNSQEATSYDFTGTVSCSDGTKCETPQESKLSLLVIISAALVDSINPCAIAVLILLITYLLNIKWSKRKMLLFGFIYIGSVFVAYLLAGLGLLKILNSVTISITVKYVIAGFIVILAALNLRDAFSKDKKSTLAIPDGAKPLIKKYMTKGTFFAIVITGFIVAAVELPCTGAIYLGILSLIHGAEPLVGAAYLIIYNLIFVLPLIIILIIAVMGKDITKIDTLRKQNKGYMKIAMSIIMILLAILLVVL